MCPLRRAIGISSGGSDHKDSPGSFKDIDTFGALMTADVSRALQQQTASMMDVLIVLDDRIQDYEGI